MDNLPQRPMDQVERRPRALSREAISHAKDAWLHLGSFFSTDATDSTKLFYMFLASISAICEAPATLIDALPV